MEFTAGFVDGRGGAACWGGPGGAKGGRPASDETGEKVSSDVEGIIVSLCSLISESAARMAALASLAIGVGGKSLASASSASFFSSDLSGAILARLNAYSVFIQRVSLSFVE